MLPFYECHKKVRAGKIIGIIRPHNDANYLAEIMTIDGSSRQVDRDWMARNPAVATGGYYVVYEDGYTAFSPAKAFEEGYNLVPKVAAGPNNAMCNPKTRLKIHDIARVCHEANRALCTGLYDNSQLPWAESPDWQIESAINGVNFNVANPDAPASASHDSWLEEKRRGGWTYGPVKNPETKEHPCFIPYEGLPQEQQAKDHLFKAIVAALSPLLDTQSVGLP